jgi:hypothetical protein
MRILILFFLISYSINSMAQPKLKGKVIIDMENGLFDCTFSITDLPTVKNYKILLNKGMNVKYFKDDSGNLINYAGHYEGKMRGEAIEYYLIDNNDTKIEPHSIVNIAYVGAFPVYENEYNNFDYKGIIAFNGKTLRATEQTKWYPVIYDEDNDKLLDKYIYDITITLKSKNETTIFINGSEPKKLKHGQFISKKPFQPLLFIGNYDFVNKNGDYILNAEVSKETSNKIFENIEKIKNVLSTNLETEFSDPIFLVNHLPINQRNKGSSWGFNTYPTFAFAGLDFKELINNEGQFSNDNYKFFGHEFSHNYFGTTVMSGSLKWFWCESFAEYLSYNVVENLCGKEFLKKVLLEQAGHLDNRKFIPLTKISNAEQISELYRYILGPLMLKCFEDIFGRAKTNLVLKNLLEIAKIKTLTIDSWEESSIKSGILKADFDTFKNTYIDNENFSKNIETEINKNYR